MTDDWPTFSEELTRKGSEQLAKWVTAYEAGKITDRELFLIANALWDTVSGLADKDLLRNLEQVIQEIRDMRMQKSGK